MIEPDSKHARLVRELFNELFDLSPEEVTKALGTHSPDPAVREEVLDLLSYRDRDSSAVDRLTSKVELGLASLPKVAGYEILREVGDGTSGRVFEARPMSDGAERRPVAVKVLRHLPQTEDSEGVSRFVQEAEVLRRLSHPGIASFVEATEAETPLGQVPCLVMEFVDGQPLTAHCDAFDLDERRRIEIVADICDAAQHAHERGIVHRDLKPANVLVDPTGRAVIVDFGVARVLGARNLETLNRTRAGELLGTLAYMSPEQALDGEQPVTARSDVYSLGVLLFQLLTGSLPLRMAGATVTEALRMIAHQDPTALVDIRPEYQGDLTTIVGRALEKDPRARYESAAALAADVRRYLAREAIAAKPPGVGEQLVRFARKNRGFAAAVSVIVCALLVGTAGLSFGVVEARARESLATEGERTARDSAARFRALTAALMEVVRAPNYVGQGYDVRVSEVLDGIGQQLVEAGAVPTEGVAELNADLGKTYASLGQPKSAIQHLRLAMDCFALRAEQDSDGAPTELLERLAKELRHDDRVEEALQLYQTVRIKLVEEFGEDSAEVAVVDAQRAFCMRNLGKYEDAEQLAETACETLIAELGETSSDVHEARHVWAAVLQSTGDIAQATQLQRQALSGMEANVDSDRRLVLSALGNLAQLLVQQDEDVEAIDLFREALLESARLNGEGHVQRFYILDGLAVALKHRGELDQALEASTEAAEGLHRVHGPEHRKALIALENQAQVLISLKRYDECVDTLAMLANRRQSGGEVSNEALSSFNSYAYVLRQIGRKKESLQWFQFASNMARDLHGELDRHSLTMDANLAQLLREAQDIEGSERQFLDLLDRYSRSNLPETLAEMKVSANYGHLLLCKQAYPEAEPYLRSAYNFAKTLSKKSPDRMTLTGFLGEQRFHVGDYEEARSLLLEARACIEESQVAQPQAAAHIENLLGRMEAGS